MTPTLLPFCRVVTPDPRPNDSVRSRFSVKEKNSLETALGTTLEISLESSALKICFGIPTLNGSEPPLKTALETALEHSLKTALESAVLDVQHVAIRFGIPT